MSESLILVESLRKDFFQGFFRRRVQAVADVSFQVKSGDIFGFLGPNGAGKTTTIKILTGLIRPTSGRAALFGQQVPNSKVMRKVGFLPENPYVYPFLTPREFVEMCGKLSGVSRRTIRDRARQVLEQVGVLYAADRPVRRLSKGMLQRTGLAAALVGDPELLILDEPMSGLDPVGRKEVRDIIVSERENGRTIFFSTHILSDVETLCDRVAILKKGNVVVSGKLSQLLRDKVQRTEVTLQGASSEFEDWCRQAGHSIKAHGEHISLEIEGREGVTPVLEKALKQGVNVVQVIPRHETLEDLFVREAIEHEALDAEAS